MRINIYQDNMRVARLFGAPVLYTPYFIPREDVPRGWYCYDLHGTASAPDELYAVADKVKAGDRIASFLSFLPLKNGRTKSRQIKGMFELTQEELTLAEFCEKSLVPCPEPPVRQDTLSSPGEPASRQGGMSMGGMGP